MLELRTLLPNSASELAWEQERDLACHLEEKVVLGPPRPTGDDDNDLVLLILPDLHQHLLEKRDQMEGVKRHPVHGWDKASRPVRQNQKEELVVQVSCEPAHLRSPPQLKQQEHHSL